MTDYKRRVRELESKEQKEPQSVQVTGEQDNEEIDLVHVYSTGEDLTVSEFESKYPDGLIIVIRRNFKPDGDERA